MRVQILGRNKDIYLCFNFSINDSLYNSLIKKLVNLSDL